MRIFQDVSRFNILCVVLLSLSCGQEQKQTLSSQSGVSGQALEQGEEVLALAPPLFVPTLGDSLDKLDDAAVLAFAEGKDAFEEVETVETGLGPVFNDSSCVVCHNVPAIGGSSERTVIRFGRTVDGTFDPLVSQGGSLIQVLGIGQVGTDPVCNFTGEVVPAEANVVALRITTPLFGLGLVDALSDNVFIQLAERQALLTPATAGHVNMAVDIATNQILVSKFGWKAQQPTLLQFSGSAYLNEMGITNPSFPNENCPNGNCDLIATCDPVAELEDDGRDVTKFTNFMTFLAPPTQDILDHPSFNHGEKIFSQIGCDNCHEPSFKTDHTDIKGMKNVTFFPYSDFLVHDMGSLGDGIVQGFAGPTEMRTAPLWGLRYRAALLHDGRATNVTDAILAHAGQGQAARDTFNALSSSDQAKLLAFLNSI
jgi:CxxC motif-containing protein (DUF1111 family)